MCLVHMCQGSPELKISVSLDKLRKCVGTSPRAVNIEKSSHALDDKKQVQQHDNTENTSEPHKQPEEKKMATTSDSKLQASLSPHNNNSAYDIVKLQVNMESEKKSLCVCVCVVYVRVRVCVRVFANSSILLLIQ